MWQGGGIPSLPAVGSTRLPAINVHDLGMQPHDITQPPAHVDDKNISIYIQLVGLTWLCKKHEKIITSITLQ